MRDIEKCKIYYATNRAGTDVGVVPMAHEPITLLPTLETRSSLVLGFGSEWSPTT